MFNGSSNITIQGGTFILVGSSIDSASLMSLSRLPPVFFCFSAFANLGTFKEGLGVNDIPQDSTSGSNTVQGPMADQSSYSQPEEPQPSAQKSCKPHWHRDVDQSGPVPRSHSADNIRREMSASIPQDSTTASNSGQGPTTNQFSYTQEANAQESSKPHVDQFDPVPRSHSTDNFETSVQASGQVPENGPFPMPTPSIADDASRTVETNVDLQTLPPLFPTPIYFSKPQYGMFHSKSVLRSISNILN